MEEKLRFTKETLAHLNTIEDVAMFATTTLFSVIPTHKISVAVINGDTLKFVNTIGKRVIPGLKLEQPSINTRTIRTGQTQLVNDTSKDPDYYTGDPNDTMSSELCVPMIHGGKILGTINFEHMHPSRYTENDVHLAEAFAMEIAEAVNRVHEARQAKGSQAVVQVTARSPIEMYRDLLRTVKDGETVLNRILNRTAIQWKPGKELVNELVTKGYLNREMTSGRRYAYRITEEGVQALGAYDDVVKRFRTP